MLVKIIVSKSSKQIYLTIILNKNAPFTKQNFIFAVKMTINFKTMKNFKQLYNRLLIINAILGLAIVALFVLHFTGDNDTDISDKDVNKSVHNNVSNVGATGASQIAVVKLDTLVLEYKLAQDLNESLLQKQKEAEATFQLKMSKFERDYKSFQEKSRLGSFLSQASMEAQQSELMQQQEDLQGLQQSLTMQLSQDQESMTQRLYDSVINNIPTINDGRFVLVLGDAVGANILYSEQTMDITREVLDFLNSRYNSTETE